MKIQGYFWEKSESAFGFSATSGTLENRVKPLWLPRKKVESIEYEGVDVSNVFATDGRYGARIATVEIDDKFAQRIGIA